MPRTFTPAHGRGAYGRPRDRYKRKEFAFPPTILWVWREGTQNRLPASPVHIMLCLLTALPDTPSYTLVLASLNGNIVDVKHSQTRD